MNADDVTDITDLDDRHREWLLNRLIDFEIVVRDLDEQIEQRLRDRSLYVSAIRDLKRTLGEP